ncbi:hypothetical protein AB0M28_28455 [Streptomyces sp. NPDC051940]|uniref:hypothetical protein n=1 Tax=Streptomyces sp. NPDC051940 TaxID=3155675 RepID=UPI003444B6A0
MLGPVAVADAAGVPVRGGCDPIAPSECLLPFPSDWYTVPDPGTDTGRRVAFDPAAMPRNALGKGIDPTDWNRNDGFSPGSMLLAQIPGLDLARTGAAPLTDIGRSLHRDAPIVLLDADTGQRWPYWAELDANATDPARQALVIRPARNFLEGHRYVVALRGLKDAAGHAIPAGDAFRTVAGRPLPAGDPLYERQQAMRRVQLDLLKAGVPPVGLNLAWDFTIASERGLSERMLKIRDDSFAALDGKSPQFAVTEVTENPATDPIARRVRGTFQVPSYLNAPGGPPGSRFNYGPDGLPAQLPGNTQTALFQCEVPRSSLAAPAKALLYGHGLLGRETEVGSGSQRALAAEHNVILCATRWQGMAQEDLPYVAGTIGDLGGFGAIADRTQQGVLNFLWLGKLMMHADGLSASPAFQGPSGASVIDTAAELGYNGNSQGGILGGMLTAVSTDVTKAVLGVPAMNYSTLLNRSVDYAPFQAIMDQAYPDKLTQQIGFALMQMLWDRGEANGYAQHMTRDPLPGTPAHQVLLDVAFGDHQVSPTAAEVEARTIGARIHTPAVAPGRNPDVVRYWGIPPLHEPQRGSAIVIWDSGSPYQPLTNTPPTEGHDPHSDLRNSPIARQQAYTFLTTGVLTDVCGDAPCTMPAG